MRYFIKFKDSGEFKKEIQKILTYYKNSIRNANIISVYNHPRVYLTTLLKRRN